MLLVLLLVAGGVLFLVYLAVRRRVIVWEQKSAKQAAIEVRVIQISANVGNLDVWFFLFFARQP